MTAQTTVDVKAILASIRAEGKSTNDIDPYHLAHRFGIHYCGDVNLEHGGFFFSSTDWAHDYANCVDVCISEDTLFVQTGIINKNDIDGALRCCGYKYDDEKNIVSDYDSDIIASHDDPQAITLVEIEACKAYAGAESDYDDSNDEFEIDDSDYPEVFIVDGKRIPMDNLQGYVFNHYVQRICQ